LLTSPFPCTAYFNTYHDGFVEVLAKSSFHNTMINPSTRTKNIKRNLRALFGLAFLLALLSSLGGCFILAISHSHPRVTFTMPAWQYGQFLMLLGFVNLSIYLGILWQVRALLRDDAHRVETLGTELNI
jgi:hypothetical protein